MGSNLIIKYQITIHSQKKVSCHKLTLVYKLELLRKFIPQCIENHNNGAHYMSYAKKNETFISSKVIQVRLSLCWKEAVSGFWYPDQAQSSLRI